MPFSPTISPSSAQRQTPAQRQSLRIRNPHQQSPRQPRPLSDRNRIQVGEANARLAPSPPAPPAQCSANAPAKPVPEPRPRSSRAASSAKPPRWPAPRRPRAPPPPPSRRTSSQSPESIRVARSRPPFHLSVSLQLLSLPAYAPTRSDQALSRRPRHHRRPRVPGPRANLALHLTARTTAAARVYLETPPT